jgi:putative endonuclease
LSSKTLGDRGEEIAARHLARAGWTVTHRNFRLGSQGDRPRRAPRRGRRVRGGEDARGLGYGHPLESITAKKRREIARVATAWIERHGADGDVYRFDAVAVLVRGGEPEVEHVEDAWRM